MGPKMLFVITECSLWPSLAVHWSAFFSYLTIILCALECETTWGSSINDVTVLGGRGYQGFCDDSTKALVLKSVTMGGGGVKNYQKLRDVIYGRTLMDEPLWTNPYGRPLKWYRFRITLLLLISLSSNVNYEILSIKFHVDKPINDHKGLLNWHAS